MPRLLRSLTQPRESELVGGSRRAKALVRGWFKFVAYVAQAPNTDGI